jgi:hypothetical protein
MSEFKETPTEEQEVIIDTQAPTDSDLDNLLGIKVENSEKGPEPMGEGPDPNVLEDFSNNFDPQDFFDQDGNPKPSNKENDLDAEMVSEFGIELLDLVLGFGARGLANDWDENSSNKYEISEKKKKQLQKPLAKILQRRGAKISPEALFLLMMVALYFPMYYSAWKKRATAKKAEEQKKAKEVKPKSSPAVKEKAEPTEKEAITLEKDVDTSVWLRKGEASKLANVSEKTLGRWGETGKVTRMKVQKLKSVEWYYNKESVKNTAIAERVKQQSPGAEKRGHKIATKIPSETLQ